MKYQDALQELLSQLTNASDIMQKNITVADKDCVLVYLDGMTDKQQLEQDILRPLALIDHFEQPYADALKRGTYYAEDFVELPSLDEAVKSVADGDIVFLADESAPVLFSMRKFNFRSVSEPPTSSVLKGPREGFVEEFKTNVTLLRRKLRTPSLAVKYMKIGRYSQTNVAVVHIDGIADQSVLERLEQKLEAIDVDGIIDSSYVSSFISDNKYSLFSTVGNSEKPDVIAAKLLEGRVAIVVDGSPIVLTVPFVLLEDLQDGYDYYQNDWRASMIRIFRLVGAIFTIALPGAYVALQSYHYHLLPIKFLMTLVNATSGIPFPPAIELLVVLILFEILNQASVRMPRFLGISLSVVGAIVLGDTAVKAGLISSPAVLVTALSSIGIFCVPDQVGTMSTLRFLFLCVSAVFGFYGMIVFALLLLTYLCGLQNFYTPYLAPFAPRISADMKDALFKSDESGMTTRPYSIPNAGNRVRLRQKGGEEQ